MENCCKNEIPLIKAELIKDEDKIISLEERVEKLEKQLSNRLFWTVLVSLLTVNIGILILVILL